MNAWLKEFVSRAGWRLPAAAAGLVVLAAAPWWGPPILARLSYFRVRRVEIYGRRYIGLSQVLGRLGVDTTMSVWMDLTPLERRLAADPQVRRASVERKLPGTLVVRLMENPPVALVPIGQVGVLRTVDASGRVLPIDPSRARVDLPVVARPDTALLRLLADVRARFPGLFARISSAQRVNHDEVEIAMSDVLVRAMAGVSAQRLADIIPVESDLARRHARVDELDLRYRDQVIARLQ